MFFNRSIRRSLAKYMEYPVFLLSISNAATFEPLKSDFKRPFIIITIAGASDLHFPFDRFTSVPNEEYKSVMGVTSLDVLLGIYPNVKPLFSITVDYFVSIDCFLCFRDESGVVCNPHPKQWK
jgi:hypothetical protein